MIWLVLNKPCNMGKADRLIRFTFSIPLIYLGFLDAGVIGDNLLNLAVGVFGGMNMISAIVGICPAYLLVNISTVQNSLVAGTNDTPGAPIDALKHSNEITVMRRKLMLSVVIPMTVLLVLFGWTVFHQNQQTALTELSQRQDVAAQIAIHIQRSQASIEQDTSAQFESVPASDIIQQLLTDTEMFLVHDSQLNPLSTYFAKGAEKQSLIDALRDNIGSFDALGNAYSRGTISIAGENYLWSTTPFNTPEHWITAVWKTQDHHALSSRMVSIRIAIIALAVVWMAIWSSSYVVRKFLDNVEDNARRLNALALHDSLTELPNRLKMDAIIDNHVKRMNSASECVVLLMVDLIEFRDVNDTLGHAMGDQLLVTVSKLLRELEHDKTTVLRMGGDTFCLVCTVGQNTIEATHLANKVHEKLGKSHELNGIPVAIQARIGLSRFPMDSSDATDLVRLADIALA